MSTSTPSLDQWRHAFRLADAVHDMAPWRWFGDTDRFAFRDPQTGQCRAVSLMGFAGEHLAVAVYTTIDGVFAILDMASSEHPRPSTVLITGQHDRVAGTERDRHPSQAGRDPRPGG